MIITQETLIKNPKKYISFYKRNGFILIKGFLNKTDFRDVHNTIIEILSIHCKIDKKRTSLDNKDFNKTLIKLRKNNPKKFALFFDSLQTTTSITKFWTENKILNLIKVLSDKKKICFSATDMLLRVDSPIDQKNKLNWHQDSSYFRQNKNGFNGINCWAPLVNLTSDMGPLEILIKSHSLGPIKVKKKRNKDFGSLQRTIPINLINRFKSFSYEMKMGDMLFMNMDMVHRSGLNLSNKFRFSALCRFHKIVGNDFNPGLNIYRYSDKKLNKEVHGF